MKNINKTIERFTGFAQNYYQYRPTIPIELFAFIRNLVKERPSLIVDLGSGTGESTLPWAEIADKVIGIEPSFDMYKQALTNKPVNVEYINQFAESTNIESKSADIITCSSSLHWIEPYALAKEIERILKSNGIFCSYGYYYPFFNESWLLTKQFEEWRLDTQQSRQKDQRNYAMQFNVNETIEYFKSIELFRDCLNFILKLD